MYNGLHAVYVIHVFAVSRQVLVQFCEAITTYFHSQKMAMKSFCITLTLRELFNIYPHRQLLKFCNRITDHIHDGCIFSVDDLMLEVSCFVLSVGYVHCLMHCSIQN